MIFPYLCPRKVRAIMLDKRNLEQILSDQQEELEIRRGETLCHRPEEALIDLSSTQAQVVIGVRRSGKSTLCFQALEKAGVKYAYVDFDDERLAKIQAEDLNDILEVLYKIYGDFNYLFLDEIQNIEGWHLFVNRMLRKRMHVIVTGSNAKLLSSDLATHLSGRSKEIPLYPFSFYEYCLMKEVDTDGMSTKKQAFRRAAFDDYLKLGGFPELLIIGEHQTYVKNLVSNILQRDIEQRFKITYQATFEQLVHHLLNVAPVIVSSSELSATLGVKSEHTIRKDTEHRGLAPLREPYASQADACYRNWLQCQTSEQRLGYSSLRTQQGNTSISIFLL